MWVHTEDSKLGDDVALEQMADQPTDMNPQVSQPGIPTLGSVVGDWDGK